MNFDTLPTSSSFIDCSNYQFDSTENSSDEPSTKRKQPKRTAKKQNIKTVPEKECDNLKRKIMIYKGNKFYCDRQTDRKLIWKCSTSRFTNCTAELMTKLNDRNGSQIIETGIHDHANNTE